MDDLCSEDVKKVIGKNDCCVVCDGSKKIVFFVIQLLFEQINRIRTTVHGDPQLSLECTMLNRISFDVFDRCFYKVATRAFEMLRSCAKQLKGLAVTALPGASCSFNLSMGIMHLDSAYCASSRGNDCAGTILPSVAHNWLKWS